jgi:hypothetical protein
LVQVLKCFYIAQNSDFSVVSYFWKIENEKGKKVDLTSASAHGRKLAWPAPAPERHAAHAPAPASLLRSLTAWRPATGGGGRWPRSDRPVVPSRLSEPHTPPHSPHSILSPPPSSLVQNPMGALTTEHRHSSAGDVLLHPRLILRFLLPTAPPRSAPCHAPARRRHRQR